MRRRDVLAGLGALPALSLPVVAMENPCVAMVKELEPIFEPERHKQISYQSWPLGSKAPKFYQSGHCPEEYFEERIKPMLLKEYGQCHIRGDYFMFKNIRGGWESVPGSHKWYS